MDALAKESFLDEEQWERAVARAKEDQKEFYGKIKRVTVLSTINSLACYVEIEMNDGKKWVADLRCTRGDEIEKTLAKCQILGTTVFEQV